MTARVALPASNGRRAVATVAAALGLLLAGAGPQTNGVAHAGGQLNGDPAIGGQADGGQAGVASMAATQNV